MKIIIAKNWISKPSPYNIKVKTLIKNTKILDFKINQIAF